MPVKISTTTNPSTGEIQEQDLARMKSEFDINTEVRRSNPGNPIIKKIAWYISRAELEELITLMSVDSKKPELLEINFAINLSGVNDVCGHPISDSITLVIEAKTEDKESIAKNPEYIIIPGFKSNTTELTTLKMLKLAGPEPRQNKDCCPSSKPGSNP